MATRSKIGKRNSNQTELPSSSQLVFDFGKAQSLPVHVEVVSENRIEVFAPPPTTVTAALQEANVRSDGAEENRYLLHQADKYEERALKTLLLFLAAACLTLLVKSGIPTGTVTEKLGIPNISNTRLLAGMLASSTILFASGLAYFALRIRQHSPQLRLRFVERSWAGYVAQYMLWIGTLLVAAFLVAVVKAAGRDIWFLFTYVIDRQLYVLDGWDPVKR